MKEFEFGCQKFRFEVEDDEGEHGDNTIKATHIDSDGDEEGAEFKREDLVARLRETANAVEQMKADEKPEANAMRIGGARLAMTITHKGEKYGIFSADNLARFSIKLDAEGKLPGVVRERIEGVENSAAKHDDQLGGKICESTDWGWREDSYRQLGRFIMGLVEPGRHSG